MSIFKRILFITSNRSDYAKVRSLLQLLRVNPNFNIDIFATGTMVSERYSMPVLDVIGDGFSPIIDEYCGSADSLAKMVKSIGISLMDISSYICGAKPDCGIIVGDRWDILPAAISLSLMNIPIVHIQGGELSGTIDNVIRDVITKMSHIHFTSTEKSRERVISLGEDASHVFNTGCPSIDFIHALDIGSDVDLSVLKRYIKNPFILSKLDNYIIVMVHPNVTDPKDIDVEIIFKALLRLPNKKIWFYPNNDPYSEDIMKAIRKYRNEIIVFSHMDMRYFFMLLGHSSCIVGNSSSGIRESASFGIPAINIGNRQIGRERNDNVIDIDCDEDTIYKTVKGAIGRRYMCNNIYGDGKSSERIINTLSKYDKLNYKNIHM